jgi:hypothetical protein
MGGDIHVTAKYIQYDDFMATLFGRFDQTAGRIEFAISRQNADFQGNFLKISDYWSFGCEPMAIA